MKPLQVSFVPDGDNKRIDGLWVDTLALNNTAYAVVIIRDGSARLSQIASVTVMNVTQQTGHPFR